MNCSNGLAWASYERHRAIATGAALADRPYKWEEGGEVECCQFIRVREEIGTAALCQCSS